MNLWIDKYKPVSLSDVDYHKKQALGIQKLITSGNFPHLLVFGPSGAGKKTRIQCILNEIYGPDVEKLRIQHYECVTPSNKKIDINLVASNYHIEVNPSDAGFYDRIVVQDLIKTASSAQQLDMSQQRSFKVIVIHEMDKLSVDAQHALRRTMEKCLNTCRLILCADSSNKIIPAVRSRCLPVRVPAPSQQQIVSIIADVCRKEGLTIPTGLANRIAAQASGNLRQALLLTETCRVQQYPFSEDQRLELPEWLSYAQETAKLIINEQTPKRLLEVRTRLYELLVHCIPPELIMKTLVAELSVHCDMPLRRDVYILGAEYESRMRIGEKPIFHLEAFVARFMSEFGRTEANFLLDEDW